MHAVNEPDTNPHRKATALEPKPLPVTSGPGWLQSSGPCSNGEHLLCIVERLELRLEHTEQRCAWYWRSSPTDIPRPMRQQPDLLAPLADPDVLALLGDQLLKQSPDHDPHDMPTMASCREAMQAHLDREPAFTDWQADWQHALSIFDSELFDLACQASLTPGRALSAQLYTCVWQHRAAFRDVASNAPGLMPLLALALADNWQPSTPRSALKDLRRRVCELPACGPATWRWLNQHGTQAIHPLISQLSDGPWTALAAFLSLWTRAGLPPPLPESAMAEWAGHLCRASQLHQPCPDRIAIIARHAESLAEPPAACVAQELAVAMVCILDTTLPALDRNQKRAGWPRLKRELQQYRQHPEDEMVMSRLRDRLPASIRIEGFDLAILRDHAAIVEEGERLNHCMKDNPFAFQQDARLHFSIHCARTSQPMATCTLVGRGQRLILASLFGIENGSVPAAARRAAQRLARQLSIAPAPESHCECA